MEILCFAVVYLATFYYHRRIISKQRQAIRVRDWNLSVRDREIAALKLGRDVFTCPRCGMVSYHPMDLQEGYCGNCHAFTAAGQSVRAGKKES